MQIFDRIAAIAQAFARDSKLIGPPYARAEENAFIAVAEEVINRQVGADVGIWTDADAHLNEDLFQPVEDIFGQAECRNAISKDSADLVPRLE